MSIQLYSPVGRSLTAKKLGILVDMGIVEKRGGEVVLPMTGGVKVEYYYWRKDPDIVICTTRKRRIPNKSNRIRGIDKETLESIIRRELLDVGWGYRITDKEATVICRTPEGEIEVCATDNRHIMSSFTAPKTVKLWKQYALPTTI